MLAFGHIYQAALARWSFEVTQSTHNLPRDGGLIMSPAILASVRFATVALLREGGVALLLACAASASIQQATCVLARLSRLSQMWTAFIRPAMSAYHCSYLLLVYLLCRCVRRFCADFQGMLLCD